MKNLKLMLPALAAAAMITLSGCGDLAQLGHGMTLSETMSEVQAHHTSVIVQNGSNSGTIDGSVLSLSPSAGDSVSLVCPDGSATVVFERTYSSSANNGVYQERERGQWHDELAASIAGTTPDAPQTDILSALNLSARTLNTSADGTKTLAIMNNGLNTVSPLFMQDDAFWYYDVDSLVDQLNDKGYCCDLSGIDVHWWYLSDTAGLQNALSPQQRQHLEDFWSAFLTRCNAASVTFHSDILSTEAPTSAPEIAEVPVIEEVLDFSAAESETPAAVALDQTSLAFKPNSCDFADSAAAQAALSQAAAQLMASADTYTVAGSVALVEGADPDTALLLSQQRAATVRDALVTLGVPADRLPNVIGLGTAQTSLRSTDDQALNRSVYLVPGGNEALTAELLAVGTAA